MSTVDAPARGRIRVEEKTIVFANEPEPVVLFDDSESDWHPTIAYTAGKGGEDIREVLRKAKEKADASKAKAAPVADPEPEPEPSRLRWLPMVALVALFASAGVGTGFWVMRASTPTVTMPTGTEVASRVPLWSEDPVARGLLELDRMSDE